MKKGSFVVDWLLEENQPSIRYLTLTELLGRTEKDPEVKRARENITKTGWAKDILDEQMPSGCWVHEKSLFMPTFHATFWMLLILSDLGLTKEDPLIDRACQSWIKRNASNDGGFGQTGQSEGHLCITGNTARALVKFGYADHPKVKRAFEWLVKSQAELGGWSCWNFGRPPHRKRDLDSWEPLGAFAVYPRQKWTRSMKLACERGAEFFLERELHKQGARWEQWYRFHYPVHYYYDLLVGLDFMTALGYSDDKRLGYAISLLKEKRSPDGRWNLDANRPEESAALASWRKKHPGSRNMTPFVLEQPGRPSKMITLVAMKVMSRLGEVRRD
ncbi:MAG: terpene cyclase/mutase family protein [Nitrososphaerota archaeon]|nr:terpene cyclase/mutase family protein [Nitrososphaerota archaeon]